MYLNTWEERLTKDGNWSKSDELAAVLCRPRMRMISASREALKFLQARSLMSPPWQDGQ